MQKKTTTVQTIFRQVADEIIGGKYTPGEKLNEKAMAERFSVSRTPIREVLRELAAAGLVEVESHRGATVVNPDVDDLNDKFEALGEVEALCAKLSAHRMSAIERAQLKSIYQDSIAAREAGDEIAYGEHSGRLHTAIHHGCRNDTLAELAQTLWRGLLPFSRVGFFLEHDHMETSADEHDRMIDAIINSDAEEAFNLMRSHVASSSISTLSNLGNRKPDAK